MVLSAFAVAIMDTAVSSCGAETTVTTPSSVTARMSFCEDVQVTVLSSAPVTVAVSVTESPALISVTAEPDNYVYFRSSVRVASYDSQHSRERHKQHERFFH